MVLHNTPNVDEEKKWIEIFHIKVEAKKKMIDTLINFESQTNLIAKEYIRSLALTTQPHPHPHPLGWVHKTSKLEETWQWKLKFRINMEFIDEVLLDVIPLYICGIMIGSPYL